MTQGKSTGVVQQPWWRIKMLWLVIGGPLAVVIASFVTLYIVVSHPDEVLRNPAGSEPVQVKASDAAHLPALQARNHAATGGVGAK
ncbi:MAG TPA: hypothetical protein PKC59_13825 [Burkholderiaceae bacterium]|nr:hypothetical protein [Burkholderiaceae bacterium]HMX12268.1 hypothetical protein [Burkholderiaceae bacterium]HMZ01720.1 hypothetical protein [Burkholderiaceae bacterium]HNB43021.1 hypothetical protein [Burkholderiaceae bacterium]HNG80278.1 hypothetical protein [Burkholderiaceae bacterium]